MAIAEPSSPHIASTPKPPAAASRDARPLRGVVVLLVAAALSIAALVVDGRHEARVPAAEPLAVAVEQIRAGFEAGDAIVVLPNWYESVWQDLAGLGEGLGRWPFPALQRGDVLDPLELLRFDRVWVLSAFHAPPVLSMQGLAGMTPAEHVELGDGVALARYDLPRLDARARLTDDVARLVVERHLSDGRAVKCPWKDGRHRCGLDPWLDPRVESRNVFHREVAWLYAHPGPGNAVLSVSWPGAPTGAALVVRVGLNQKAVRSEPGGPVTVRTWVDGEVVDTFSLAPHSYVLERRLVGLPPGRSTHDVRFEVQADPPDWRQLMLEADILGGVPEALDQWLTPATPR